jgi:hypothetical protein
VTRDLDRQTILELLGELGDRLAAKGQRADFYIVGGAAMLLAYGREQMTRDIDAVFEPKAVIYREAEAMAKERPWLGDGWLNDAVKGFINGPDPDPAAAKVVLKTGSLSVQVASPRRLLAMKVAASRVERDRDDILTLAALVGARSIDEVLAIAHAEYGDRLGAKSRFLVTEALDGVLPQRPPETREAEARPN